MTTETGSITFLPASSAASERSLLINKEQAPKSSGFGGKTIGFVGGFALLVSNLTGPGLVSLSLVYQESGWLYPTVSLVLMMIMSTLSGVFLCEAMATIPGNESLQGRVEFATLARFYFGRKGHIASQVFINTALQATNIAGIVISSQVLDSMFVRLFHRTCGLELHPQPFHWHCVDLNSPDESPFGNAFMLFTIGYLVVMAVIIPLGYLNLDDNIIIQIAALIFLVAVIGDWVTTFLMTGLPEAVQPFTQLRRQVGVLGTIMFNYAYITTIPSWVNEKKPSVSVHKSLWSACIVSTFTFFAVGYLGARAFKDMPLDSDILSVINNSPFANELSRILVYLFPLMVLATSIPVYSIIVRYNLLQNNVVSKAWANIFAVVIPWVVAIPFMQAGALNILMNWSSLLFASGANFIIPFVIYIKASQFRLSPHGPLTREQLEIIRSMHENEHDTDDNAEKKEEKDKEEPKKLLPGSLPTIIDYTSPSINDHHHHHVIDTSDALFSGTPLHPHRKPPSFTAVPRCTPQQACTLAIAAACTMLILILAVIVLAIVF